MDEHEFELKRQRLATVDAAVRNITKWVPILGVAYFASKCVDSLAGKTTIATIIGKFALDLKLNRFASLTLAWILAGGTSSWAVLERRLRHRNGEKLAAENTRLERLIDPGRSSSRLTPKGTTRKGDEI